MKKSEGNKVICRLCGEDITFTGTGQHMAEKHEVILLAVNLLVLPLLLAGAVLGGQKSTSAKTSKTKSSKRSDVFSDIARGLYDE